MDSIERWNRKYLEDENFQSLNTRKTISAENDFADDSGFPKMIRHRWKRKLTVIANPVSPLY